MSRKAKSISDFGISTLYPTIPHKLLKKLLSEDTDFDFKLKVKRRIDFFKTFIYRTSKGAERRYFIKQTLVNAMSFLINKCFFAIGNVVF